MAADTGWVGAVRRLSRPGAAEKHRGVHPSFQEQWTALTWARSRPAPGGGDVGWESGAVRLMTLTAPGVWNFQRSCWLG